MELASLLESAQAAPPERRIEWRDGIAAHGASAIEGVRPWLVSGSLAAFAVRVIERAGINGEAELASKVLRAARPRVPEEVAPDVDWALQRLKAAMRPQPATPVAPAAVTPVRRTPARSALAARRRPR
jgi:hypothetical protein